MPAAYLDRLLAIEDVVNQAEADAAKKSSGGGGGSTHPNVVNGVGAGGYVVD